MQIVIDIPDEQIKKSLEESKYIYEDEGEKGFVNITMLYANARLEFVDVERKTDFYSCKYKILPKGHGDLIDKSKLEIGPVFNGVGAQVGYTYITQYELNEADVIIEADKESEE